LSFKDEAILSFEPTSDKFLENYYCTKIYPGNKVLKLGILYGANASGKTNILKSLDFLRSQAIIPKRDKLKKVKFTPFLFDPSTKDAPGEFSITFFVDQFKYIYSIILNNNVILSEKLVYYPSNQPALLFDRTYDPDHKISSIKFGEKSKLSNEAQTILKGNTINNTSVIASYSISNVTSQQLDKVLGWFKFSLRPIILPSTNLLGWTNSRVEESQKCKDFVLEVLNKADFAIEDIQFQEKELELDNNLISQINKMPIPEEEKQDIIEKGSIKPKILNFIHKALSADGESGNHLLPQDLESQGTLRYYGLSGVLNLLINDKVTVSIDELENSLHYDLLIHFIKTFLVNSEHSQLIFSTHDISILNERDLVRRDTIWFTEKNDKGFSELFSLSDFKFHKNISEFNRYRIGKLGAKPNLGNIFITNTNEKKPSP
ncbi:MAG: AAA family ATPase, partial [Bacteroidales bacterium]